MIDPEGAIDILYRIDTVRDARCGGSAWVPPPADWADIVQRSWPQVWRTTLDVPGGWCDLVMAFSEHMTEIAEGRRMAFEAGVDFETGGIMLKRHHAFWGQYEEDIMLCYCSIAVTTCHACSAAGKARLLEKWGIVRVLCDDHWQGP